MNFTRWMWSPGRCLPKARMAMQWSDRPTDMDRWSVPKNRTFIQLVEKFLGLKNHSCISEHSSLETWFWFQWILTTPFDQDFGVLRYEVHIGHILCKNHEIWQPWHPFFEKILSFFRCYWYLGKNTQQNHVLNFLPISLFKMVSYDHKNDCQPWKFFKFFYVSKYSTNLTW